ncbi:hypothetical protein PENTCL1PPCAC_9873, partial [Pristionchus entomophagus]
KSAIVLACLLFSLVSSRPGFSEEYMQNYRNGAQLLRNALKMMEDMYEENEHEKLPVSDYVDTTKFTRHLANLVFHQAARTAPGFSESAFKGNHGEVELMKIAKTLSELSG